MSASGFTPISLYYSSTGAAVPSAGNLVAGELALNTNDGKLYYKNSSGVVTLLAGATSGPAGGSTTQVQYNNAGVLAGITGATTNGTAMTLVAPVLGTPASATLTNATGLPISSGVSGLGTGVATALGVNTGSAGAMVLFNGALGTPTSGTVTNLTGTASININGTVGATTPAAGSFTTVTTSGNVGVGVTLETFSTLYGQRAIQVGKVGVYSSLYVNSGNHQTYLSSNVYNYSGTPTYLADGAASHYVQASGEHAWSTAPSGLIGAAVTLTERMALSTTGLAVTGTLSATSTASATTFYPTATSGVGIQMTSTGNNNGNWTIANNYGQMMIATEGTAGSLVTGSSQGAALFGNSSNVSAQFFTNNTVRATLDSSGNVGIGMTPTNFGNGYTVLQVAHATNGGMLYLTNTANAGGRIYGNAAGLTYDSFGATYQAFNTNSSERVRIDSSGNVGIGTTGPLVKLMVVGTGAAWGNDTGLFDIRVGSSTNDARVSFGYSPTGNYGWIRSVRPNVANDILILNPDGGNVGIGMTSPALRLDVTGTIRSDTQLRVDVGGGAWLLNTDGSGNTLSQISRGSGNNMALQSYGGFSFAPNNSSTVQVTIASGSYLFELASDSAGKPGVGGLWTVVSDERIKSNIVPANLDRCYEIVKSVPLKHFGFAPGVYTDDQIQDKHNLGWIAQDVQKVFKNAVSIKPFTLKTDIPDGVEEYEEQDFTLESVETTEISIQVINGKPVQVSKVVTAENKVLLFDTVDVVDEAGDAVMENYEVTPAVQAVDATDEVEAVEAVPAVMGTRPVTYQMPRMITKTRPKVRHDVIEDCLDLNSGQMIAALYGCVQALMAKVEALEAK